jgi:hypothetical protein
MRTGAPRQPCQKAAPLILERGEPVDLPPALIIQRTTDDNHPLEMQRHLVEWYTRRGGHIEMPLYENLPPRFSITPDFPDTFKVVDDIADFIHRHQ